MVQVTHMRSRAILYLVLILFVIAGVMVLAFSRANTPSIAVEPEAGSISIPTTVITDSGASGGKAVKFNNQTPPPGAMWIGAAQNIPNTSVASFLTTSNAMGPLKVRRSFSSAAANVPSTLPAVIAGDKAAGILSFYSCKVSGGPAAILNGSQDNNLRALFNSMPHDRTSWFTMWHEPENDINTNSFTSKQFRDMIAHIWDVKQSSPNAANIKVGYIAMDYWWRSGTSFATNGDQMLPPSGKFDYLGVDNYNTATTSGRTNLSNDPAFLNWFNWAKTKNKALYVTEFGRKLSSSDPNARANDLLASEAFLKKNGFEMFLYWNGSGAQGDWKLYDTPSQNAWKAISSRGR